jgi:hypothetical protein
MRSTKSILSVFAVALALSACSRANDRGTAAPIAAPIAGAPVSVTLESPGIGALPSALFGGSLYYAGQDGQQYVVRVANNTARRVEVVVTVDGRDVVSGQLGDYRKQRGYIIEPFGQIAIDGFRQSFDQVAAFRFSGLQDSYTALQGTPQHAGVVGIAVFEERGNPKASGPLAVGPSTPTPFPSSGGDRDVAAGRIATAPHDSRMAAEDEPAAPAAEAGASADFNARKSEVAPSAAPGGGNFAPPPVPRNELGTEYGESQASSVHEVAFKRKHKRRPDAVFSVFYDSPNGLAARGIPLGGGGAFAPAPAPQPFPDRAPRR